MRTDFETLNVERTDDHILIVMYDRQARCFLDPRAFQWNWFS